MCKTVSDAEEQVGSRGDEGPNGDNSLVAQEISQISRRKLGYGICEKEEGRDEPNLGVGDVQIPHNEGNNRRDVEPVKIEAAIDKPQEGQDSILGSPELLFGRFSRHARLILR